MIPLILLLLTAAPPSHELTDHVDIIELNHVVDANGCESFRQWIFWEWSHHRKRYDVVAWRIAKTPYVLRGNRLSFRDGEATRVIQAVSYRETWTRGDPEVIDRDWLPAEFRRGLGRQKNRPAR